VEYYWKQAVAVRCFFDWTAGIRRQEFTWILQNPGNGFDGEMVFWESKTDM
jgi:hypothetical protein